MSSAGERLESDLDRIITDYLRAQDRGAAPDVDELIARHPQHEASLREFFAAEVGIRRLSPGSAGADPLAPEASHFGDYEIVELIARGGMGAVYKARQASLDRVVALKMILGGKFASPEQVQRLQREAQAVAALEHPHIVPIYEVGEHDGVQFFSMQYVEGGSLREKIGLYRDDPRRAARLVETVASAVHAVHERGILHRDLKPGNILLEADGTPKISDFGLAKQLEDDHSLTIAGSAVGTPHYMSPEQAAGRTQDITVTSDVYGLGAILYHLLAGRAPFQGESSYTLLRKVQEEPPPGLRSSSADVPRDLAIICHKCLEKEPSRRYASASDLAADLGRFLAHEPIAARPTPAATRAVLWCRRNPAAVIVLLLLTVIAVGSFVAALKLGDERDAAQSAGDRARDRLRESLVTEARALRYTPQAGRRATGLSSLKQAAAIRPGIDVRNEAIAYLAIADMEFSRDWPGHDPNVIGVAFDNDYEHYARAARSGRVSVRTVEGDAEIVALETTGSPDRLDFSPNGEYLAVSTHTGSIAVYHWRTREKKIGLADILTSRQGFDFDPTRNELVLACDDGKVRWYDIESGAAVHEVDCKRALMVRCSPRGGRLAVVRHVMWVSIVDAADGGITHTFRHPERIFPPTWGPDGARILVPCEDRNVYCWDTRSGDAVHVFGPHGDKATEACFTVDSRAVITSGYDRMIRMWDAHSGDSVLEGPGVAALRMADDGQHFGYVKDPPALRLARLEPSPVLHTCDGPGSGTHRGMGIDPAGRWIATSHGDGVRLWNLATGEALGYLPVPFTLSSQFSPDGTALLTCGHSGLYRWPVSVGDEGRHIELGPPQRIETDDRTKRAVFAPAGDHIAVISEVQYYHGRYVHVVGWEEVVKNGRAVAAEPLEHWGVHSVSLSGDGRWVASAPWQSNHILVRDLSTPERTVTAIVPERVNADVIFSPRSTWLVAVTGREYRFFETGRWDAPVWTITREDPEGIPGPVAIRPDEKLIAVVQNKTQVALYDAHSRNELARVASPRDHVVQELRFSADGRYLIAATNPIEVWDLHALESELFALGLHWSPDSHIESAEPEARDPFTLSVDLGVLADPDGWPDGKFPVLAETALRTLERSLAADPADGEARLLRARILARLDRVVEALDEMDAAVAAAASRELLHERAVLRERAGLTTGAIADYSELLDSDPADTAARVRRGTLLLRGGETSAAQRDIDLLLKAPVPKTRLAKEAAWLLTLAPANIANRAQAEFLARSASAKLPDDSDVLRVLAAACYRTGKYRDSLQAAERAIGTGDRGRGTTLDYLLIGLSHHGLGDTDRAVPYLSRGLDWRGRERHGRPIEELRSFLDEARRIIEGR